jgi:hypothetical protein
MYWYQRLELNWTDILPFTVSCWLSWADKRFLFGKFLGRDMAVPTVKDRFNAQGSWRAATTAMHEK